MILQGLALRREALASGALHGLGCRSRLQSMSFMRCESHVLVIYMCVSIVRDNRMDFRIFRGVYALYSTLARLVRTKSPPPEKNESTDFFRLDECAPSSSISGARLTPLTRGLLDPSLTKGDRLPLLNQLSVVVAGVFEAALRCGALVYVCVRG